MSHEDFPPWSPAFDSHDDPDFLKARRTAEALGWLVKSWGSLERNIGTLLLRLIGTKYIYEITGNVDFREKLAIVKAIAFEAQINALWFEKIESLVNHI